MVRISTTSDARRSWITASTFTSASAMGARMVSRLGGARERCWEAVPQFNCKGRDMAYCPMPPRQGSGIPQQQAREPAAAVLDHVDRELVTRGLSAKGI